MTIDAASPIADALRELRGTAIRADVEVGPRQGPGWMAGDELREARGGALRDLLLRIGTRSKTSDRRTIAASFALRYGWASSLAIAPFLRHRCVPDVSLPNVSFKFSEATFFERSAINDVRGWMVAGDPRAAHPSITCVADSAALLTRLRQELVDQAAPIVETLYDWAGFARKGTWGLLTSSWTARFTGLCEDRHDWRSMGPVIDAFFTGDDVVAAMRPLLHEVAYGGEVHLYQRRASCCRWYLLPEGSLCTSCPLVSHEERRQRNLAWMKKQQERVPASGGHA